jgi:hypothetical protein
MGNSQPAFRRSIRGAFITYSHIIVDDLNDVKHVKSVIPSGSRQFQDSICVL